MFIPPLTKLMPSIYKYGAYALIAAAIYGTGWVQGAHREQLKAAKFEAATEAFSVAAKQHAEQVAKADKLRKEKADAENKRTITSLRADVKRMRDDRARSRFVPAAPAGSRSVGLACFDRADLERTLQQFDEAVTGLIAEGDADAVGLNAARSWAAGIRVDTSRGNPATIQP